MLLLYLSDTEVKLTAVNCLSVGLCSFYPKSVSWQNISAALLLRSVGDFVILSSPGVCLAVALKVGVQEKRTAEFMQGYRKNRKQNSLWTLLTLSVCMISEHFLALAFPIKPLYPIRGGGE